MSNINLSLILGLILEGIKDVPDIISSIKESMIKAGLTNDQIDQIFSGVIPYDQLGIDPNHPFADDAPPAAPVTPPVTAAAPPVAPVTPPVTAAAPPVAPVTPPITAAAPPVAPAHITARPPTPAGTVLTPKIPGPEPLPNPFEKAR